MHSAHSIGLKVPKVVIFGPKFGYEIGHCVGLDRVTDLKMTTSKPSVVTHELLVYEGNAMSSF